MKGLNRIQLIGRLGRDPEMRYTANGVAFATVSMAVDEQWQKEGRDEKKTEWFNLIFWQRLAEVASQYLTKGSLAYVDGRLQTRQYDDRDGQKRTAVEVNVANLVMLDSKPAQQQPAPPPVAPPPNNRPIDPNDDVPF